MTPIERHDSTWQDRLLDLLDGDLQGVERSTVESHVATCARCRVRYAELKRLDAKLKRRISAMAPSLDMSFERQLMARIETLDTRSRERARREAEREFDENLQALARRWRRNLVLLIGGAIAGIALAFALTSWADVAGWSEKLLGTTTGFGIGDGDAVQLLVAAAIGAVTGGGISRWVAGTLD
jgi:anti-sigma factor RsiW